MSSAYFAPSIPNNHRTTIHYTSAAPPPPSSSTRRSLRVAAEQTSPASFYEVLGIRAGATLPEIKSAYRKLARVLHPDIASGRGGGGEASGSDFIQVQAAYATLSDPEKRATYDSSLFRRRLTVASVVGGGGYGQTTTTMAPRRRTWETDQCW